MIGLFAELLNCGMSSFDRFHDCFVLPEKGIRFADVKTLYRITPMKVAINAIFVRSIGWTHVRSCQVNA